MTHDACAVLAHARAAPCRRQDLGRGVLLVDFVVALEVLGLLPDLNLGLVAFLAFSETFGERRGPSG